MDNVSGFIVGVMEMGAPPQYAGLLALPPEFFLKHDVQICRFLAL